MVTRIVNDKTFLFDPEMGLTGTTTSFQSEPKSDGNGGVLHITQSSQN